MQARGASLIAIALLTSAYSQESETDAHGLLSRYATLKTIAGLGAEEDGNFWKSQFEGAEARSVELSNPHMTMADTAGNYYIADKESHSILRVDAEGRIHTHAGTHEAGHNGDEGPAREIQLNNPNGLRVHPDGVLFILDFFNRRIRKVDRAGHLTTLLHDPAGFGPGRGLWVSRDEGLIYFNGSNSVKRWTPEGGIEIIVGSISDPGNLTVDPEGHLVVTSRGDHRVYRVKNDGGLTAIAGDGSQGEPSVDGVPATSVGLESARGIAFLASGAFFVATQKGGDVWLVDPAGRIHRFVSGARSGNIREGDGERFSTPGDKISEPRAVSVAPNGDVIITTNDKGFIRVVERFQRPRLTWLRKGQLHLEVTAGRRHTVEISEDLRSWRAWQTLPGQVKSEVLSPVPGTKAFLRVRW